MKLEEMHAPTTSILNKHSYYSLKNVISLGLEAKYLSRWRLNVSTVLHFITPLGRPFHKFTILLKTKFFDSFELNWFTDNFASVSTISLFNKQQFIHQITAELKPADEPSEAWTNPNCYNNIQIFFFSPHSQKGAHTKGLMCILRQHTG